MIGLATKASLLRAIIPGFSRQQCGRSSFIVNCTSIRGRGYVVTCGQGGSFAKRTDSGKDLFIGQSNNHLRRQLSTEEDLKSINFEKVSNETLESLSEYFDEIIEEANHLQDADVSYGDGVLTIKFGKEYGTYVLNRQVPNQQIWLSSPKSGPKRYDFIDNTWIYKHDGKSLHQLLDEEIPDIVKFPVSFHKCFYGVGRKKV